MNIITELRCHAGSDQLTKSNTPSLADVLWRRESAEESLGDVLRILQALNIEMNGRIPSESTRRKQYFTRTLVYAVAEITRLLRQAVSKLPDNVVKDDLAKAVWRIETAWSDVLSGDINLLSHIDEEESACGGGILSIKEDVLEFCGRSNA